MLPKSLRTCWMDQQERGAFKSSLGASNLTADQQRICELERELVIARIERDILKKSDGVFRKGVEVKYAMIDQLRKQHPVKFGLRSLWIQ